jgi:hypothetical protein
MIKEGYARRANLLMINGDHASALSIYRDLKNITNSGAWDFHIKTLEQRLGIKRSILLNRELGQILKNIVGIEKIYVANLAKRRDRKERLTAELIRFGVSLTDVCFIEAICGFSSAKAMQLYENFRIADAERYKSIATVPADVLTYDRNNSSVGVIGYLLTQELIIEDAIRNRHKKILVLDDDIFFSSQATSLIHQFFNQVKDWKIVLLGASEHSSAAEDKFQNAMSHARHCGYYTPFPYKTCGSFAVAYDSSILDKLLELTREYVGVFDRSVLSYFYKKIPSQCYVIKPGACCADVSESDIREARYMRKHAIQMGWDISRYRQYLKPNFNTFLAPRGQHDTPIKLAFAVTETGPDAVAGDYFTALEIGTSLATRYGWKVDYLPEGQAWYELTGVDVVVAMREDFDVHRITDAGSHLITVAWARNWFERWSEQPWLGEFSLILASSQLAAHWMSSRVGRLVHVLRIATNLQHFNNANRSAESEYDFVFTGNYWGFPRDIVNSLSGICDQYRGAIFGKNWRSVSEVSHLHRGFVRYEELADVYRRSTVVIDDANHVTKHWAAANSRIFDALSAGCLVLTNSASVSEEVFDGELPVFASAVELQDLLAYYLEDVAARESLLIRLRHRVVREHTYTQRAIALRYLLANLGIREPSD